MKREKKIEQLHSKLQRRYSKMTAQSSNPSFGISTRTKYERKNFFRRLSPNSLLAVALVVRATVYINFLQIYRLVSSLGARL